MNDILVNVYITDKKEKELIYLINFCNDNRFKSSEVSLKNINSLVRTLNSPYNRELFTGRVIQIQEYSHKENEPETSYKYMGTTVSMLNEEPKLMTVREFIIYYKSLKEKGIIK